MRLLGPAFMTAVISCCASTLALAEPVLWRSTITLPADPQELPAIDAFVIAEQLGDSLAVVGALQREDWPEHLREWCSARWAWRENRVDDALDAFDHAAATWPAASDEPALVIELFDQQRLGLALDAGQFERAEAIARTPLRPHHDAVWRGLRAQVDGRGHDGSDAAGRMARAWEQADDLERGHPVFLRAPGAYLALGDTVSAVACWQDFVGGIRRPERLRDAVRVWDEEIGLREAVARTDDPRPTLSFLTRALRREEAARIVRQRIEAGRGEVPEQELFVAEQLYRLRDHAALLDWIESTDRSGWSENQRARADAYRWGVERRAGASLEVARGFDRVAEAYPGTERAAEAWWEAAWMYELGDSPRDAVDRYARHVRATASGRYRSSAALRTVLLPWRDGDYEAAGRALEEFGEALGDGMDQAAAWWLMSQIPGADPSWARRLREEHPASPFWRGCGPAVAPGAVPGPEDLARQQSAALRLVARELGLEEPLQDLPEELTAISRISVLGLRTEAAVRLDAWARRNGSDDVARLRAVAVAWSSGLAEMHGRHAWFLQRRLGGRNPELDRALQTVSLPTPYAGTVRGIAERLDLSAALLWALMRRESFFDAEVVSLAGAYGLMQLLPTTAERVSEGAQMARPSLQDLFVPSVNVRLGSSYLAGLRQEAAGNWVRALASYNAGEVNGERWEARLREGEDPALVILLVSYTETRSYVYNVLRVTHLYEDVWRSRP